VIILSLKQNDKTIWTTKEDCSCPKCKTVCNVFQVVWISRDMQLQSIGLDGNCDWYRISEKLQRLPTLLRSWKTLLFGYFLTFWQNEGERKSRFGTKKLLFYPKIWNWIENDLCSSSELHEMIHVETNNWHHFWLNQI